MAVLRGGNEQLKHLVADLSLRNRVVRRGLLGPRKLVYFYLYVLLDVFSRYVVGWLLVDRESAALGSG